MIQFKALYKNSQEEIWHKIFFFNIWVHLVLFQACYSVLFQYCFILN